MTETVMDMSDLRQVAAAMDRSTKVLAEVGAKITLGAKVLQFQRFTKIVGVAAIVALIIVVMVGAFSLANASQQNDRLEALVEQFCEGLNDLRTQERGLWNDLITRSLENPDPENPPDPESIAAIRADLARRFALEDCSP